jgi:hypothetical protein
MASFRDRHRVSSILTLILCGVLAGCGDDPSTPGAGTAAVGPPGSLEGPFGYRGAWLAPREGHPLDSNHGSEVLRHMRGLGVNIVAVGQEVEMPSMRVPELKWGDGDAALRSFLRRARRAGLHSFLLPRIESPDFFKPPYPFRADIDFATKSEWGSFHANMERMVLHYARLAEAEGVAVFGLGLELKHSVRKFADFWRGLIAKVRRVYRGKITYSANWYDEWHGIEFWSDLDFIGVGAYFELKGPEPVGRATKAQLVERWSPIVAQLSAAAKRTGRPVLFTEVGYTGYVDCAERPWEWAGKAEKGIAIDHDVQARATAALMEIVRSREFFAGLFVWSFYTKPTLAAPWEYAVQGRPAEAALRRAYLRAN